MNIALGADHRGFALKEDLKPFLESQGHAVEDVGAYVFDKDDDYPDFAYAAALLVAEGKVDRGILLCGSGMGMDIVANKVRGVRATIVVDADAARYARDHDDVNVITLAADKLDEGAAHEIITVFLSSPFSGAKHHVRRLEKLRAIENGDVFDQWNLIKKSLWRRHTPFLFDDGDVFYARVGKNVGVETDGKYSDFIRPIAVIKKLNKDMFLGVPLTTQYCGEWFKVPLLVGGRRTSAIITQVRAWDSRRLERFVETLDSRTFSELKAKIGNLFIADFRNAPILRQEELLNE